MITMTTIMNIIIIIIVVVVEIDIWDSIHGSIPGGNAPHPSVL